MTTMIEDVRGRVASARATLAETNQPSVQVKLPLPYPTVTVYRTGTVLVTATGLRVFSLEES